MYTDGLHDLTPEEATWLYKVSIGALKNIPRDLGMPEGVERVLISKGLMQMDLGSPQVTKEGTAEVKRIVAEDAQPGARKIYSRRSLLLEPPTLVGSRK